MPHRRECEIVEEAVPFPRPPRLTPAEVFEANGMKDELGCNNTILARALGMNVGVLQVIHQSIHPASAIVMVIDPMALSVSISTAFMPKIARYLAPKLDRLRLQVETLLDEVREEAERDVEKVRFDESLGASDPEEEGNH